MILVLVSNEINRPILIGGKIYQKIGTIKKNHREKRETSEKMLVRIFRSSCILLNFPEHEQQTMPEIEDKSGEGGKKVK